MKKNPTRSEPRPLRFPEANFTYEPPVGFENEIGPLPCLRGSNAAMSCWHFPSLWDRLTFLITGRLWFVVADSHHPPISLSVTKPDLGGSK